MANGVGVVWASPAPRMDTVCRGEAPRLHRSLPNFYKAESRQPTARNGHLQSPLYLALHSNAPSWSGADIPNHNPKRWVTTTAQPYECIPGFESAPYHPKHTGSIHPSVPRGDAISTRNGVVPRAISNTMGAGFSSKHPNIAFGIRVDIIRRPPGAPDLGSSLRGKDVGSCRYLDAALKTGVCRAIQHHTSRSRDHNAFYKCIEGWVQQAPRNLPITGKVKKKLPW